jgi:hypothetical protein
MAYEENPATVDRALIPNVWKTDTHPVIQKVNRFGDGPVITGASCVFSLLGKGWSEDEFHCLETVVLQGGQDIIPVTVRVLFLDSGYQAGHLAEDLV